MAELRAVLFDLDGVLVDTHALHYQSWQRLADERGLVFDEEKGERFRGMGRPECLKVLYCEYNNLPYPSSEEAQQLTDTKNAYYNQTLAQAKPEDLVLPGAIDVLAALRNEKIIIVVASGSKNAKAVIERAQIGAYLDAIADGTDVAEVKPAPDVFLKGLERAGVAAQNAVGVEDARLGIQALRAAGLKAVGVGPYVDDADLRIPTIGDLSIEALRTLLAAD